MKIFKAFGYAVAADILSLFIGLTLASSSATLIRLISAVCTTGILVCLMVSFGLKSAREDLKAERVSGKKTNSAVTFAAGAAASLPALVSWIILYISHSSGSFDFYKWHKLINAYFLQIYNFINADASTAALSGSQVMAMLGLVFIPFVSFIVSYFLTYKGVIQDSNQ